MQVTDALRALISEGTNRPCGDHGSPPGGILWEGYTFVYSIEGGSFDGPPLGSPEEDATFVYQVTSVGATRAHAQWLADKVNWLLTSRDEYGGFLTDFPTLEGMSVIDRSPDEFSPGVVSEGTIYTIPVRYRISVVST